MGWMIRDSQTKLFSNGIIQCSGRSSYDRTPIPGQAPWVTWGKRGKVWTDVKYLKEHILKWSQLSSSGECPDTWEVLEIVESAKPINEWIDAEMVYKLLKKVNK